jgi:hypothetical protein
VDWYGEASLALAVISERALNLVTAKSALGVELAARLALGARFASSSALTPFALAQLEFVPNPPSVAALPASGLGRTPFFWLGACVGVSWGMR